MRRKKVEAEEPRVYVRPKLDRRAREARRDFSEAAHRGENRRPKQGEFDPLWLRLGLRNYLIEQRARWVVSNPRYSDSLKRHPENDPSLPGLHWLLEVYGFNNCDLVVSPGVLAVIEARVAAKRERERYVSPIKPSKPSEPHPTPAQAELFATERAA